MTVFWDHVPCSLVETDRRFTDEKGKSETEHIWHYLTVENPCSGKTGRNVLQIFQPLLKCTENIDGIIVTGFRLHDNSMLTP
jgi:hypothetical protein